jgi:hypothetical protein
MTTSKAKALRRLEHGQPSKVSRSIGQATKDQHLEDAAIKTVGERKKAPGPRAHLSVSESGKSSRGMSASVPARVSHAKRSSPRSKDLLVHAQPGNAVTRKRRNSKTANLEGRFSTPDLGIPKDGESLGRVASGRRNKATARVTALKKA